MSLHLNTIISRGTRKIPLPMMMPATMEVACEAFRTRGSSDLGFCIGSRRVA